MKLRLFLDRRVQLLPAVALLVLLATLPDLALAAGPSPVAAAVCGAQSQSIPYPSAAVDPGRTHCFTDYAIPYPAADFEGDGISYFVRSSAIHSSADTGAYSDSPFAGYAIPYPAANPDGDIRQSSVPYDIPYPAAGLY
jgi:hypothetical protein